MDNHIIAVETYGSHRVKHPRTGKTVSAYKLGYTSAVTAVLLALYGEQAQDVSSKQATYHYVQINPETVVRHGYILLALNDEELALTEHSTKSAHRAGVLRWKDRGWWEFPNNRQPEYVPAQRSGLDFNPTGFRPPSPSSGERASMVDGVFAKRSQREDSSRAWWWLTGDTYPHRELLKRHGARFSGKRKAWYWIGDSLPAAIQALVSDKPAEGVAPPQALTDDALCSDEEAAAILGGALKPNLSLDPPRLFQIGQTVYARHELETPDDGKAIPTGTRGTISRLYNRNTQHGWSYDVDFDAIGTGWFFECELTDLTPIPGIRITHGAVVPPCAVPPPTDAELKRSLVESGHQPEALATDSPSDESESLPESDMPEEPQAIRIFKPQSFPTDGAPLDEVQTAIVQAKTQPATVLHPIVVSQKRTLAAIGQSYVGELTGSITGNVWCYGYAIHEGICVFVNMGGPRMAVEAIRAKFSKSEIVNCVPWDAPAIELTSGEGNTGMYHDYMQNIPEAKFTSLILCHDLLVNPNYGGKSTTFILRTDEAQAAAKLKYHVTELVKVPVFDAWADYLYHAGQSAMLVRPTRSSGGIDLLSVDLDIDAWTRLITGGIEQGVITLPITS